MAHSATIFFLLSLLRNVHCLSSDGTHLLQFRSQISNSGETLQGWNASEKTPCLWEGVTCNAQSSVIGLSLPSKGLNGNISSALGSLRSLQNLTLYNNLLVGAIPHAIGNCSNLRMVDLSYNRLSGKIPSVLANLTNLQRLDISHNGLSGSLLDFCWKSNLDILSLSYNMLTGEIPSDLRNCKGIRRLSLDHNMLNGSIPAQFGPNLEFLDLSYNQLQGQIPSQLGGLHNLSTLKLSNNRLSGNVPSVLGNLTVLGVFDISRNNLSGTIPRIGGDYLLQLNLSFNAFQGIFPENVSSPNRVTDLLFEANDFVGNIPSTISTFKRLLNLNMKGNHFTGEIPAELGSLTVLQTLDLSNNNLSGGIPSQLGSLDLLTSLDLSSNQLSGQIPSSLGSLPLLQVNVSYNYKLEGSIPTGWDRYNASSFAATGLCGAHLLHICVESPPSSFAGHHKISAGKIFAIACGLFISMLAVGILIFFTVHSIKKHEDSISISFDEKYEILWESIMKVTENLSTEYLIADKRNSAVYKAEIGRGLAVAVKNLKDKIPLQKIRHAGLLKHQNVVRLLAYLRKGRTSLMVYEYLPNGTLGNMLHENPRRSIPWKVRYNIALGIARGLEYLHHCCMPRIIVSDGMKSEKILLTLEMEPKVADFLSVPPVNGEKVTMKTDVSSFGVLLMELLTRRSITDLNFQGDKGIVSWVKSRLLQGEHVRVGIDDPMDAIIDPDIWISASEAEKREIDLVLKIALFCSMDNPWFRPSMTEVVEMLEQSKTVSSQRFGHREQKTMMRKDQLA